MYIISKTIKGKEFSYSKEYSILCNNETQANILAYHLNKYNDDSIGDFKLKENEIWYTYKIDQYDPEPKYKIKSLKDKISITYNN